uniref:Os01g0778700 protein n=1 Tax=Macrostomum lignano TaxID=282301 RepID=A0A1I8FB68_9PLAT
HLRPSSPTSASRPPLHRLRHSLANSTSRRHGSPAQAEDPLRRLWLRRCATSTLLPGSPTEQARHRDSPLSQQQQQQQQQPAPAAKVRLRKMTRLPKNSLSGGGVPARWTMCPCPALRLAVPQSGAAAIAIWSSRIQRKSGSRKRRAASEEAAADYDDAEARQRQRRASRPAAPAAPPKWPRPLNLSTTAEENSPTQPMEDRDSNEERPLS